MRLSVTALVLSLYWVTPAACVPIPEGAQTASTNATPQVKPTVRELAMKWAYTKAMNGVDYFRAVPNVVDQQLDATQLEFWNKIAVMSEKNGLQIMKKYPEKDGVSFISSLQTAKTNYNTKKDIEELNSMLRYTIKGLPKEAQKELVQDIQRVIDATEGTESHWDRRRWHTAERQSSPVKRYE
ncbi:hypothetical protein FRB99_004133 [Tulasnella sp. 403]|nr:hypothetical protein FRB99_004133 [Tulasnella sp. 403]